MIPKRDNYPKRKSSVSRLQQALAASRLMNALAIISTAASHSRLIPDKKILHHWFRESWLVERVVGVYRAVSTAASNSQAIQIVKSLGSRVHGVLFEESFTSEAKSIIAVAIVFRLLALPLSVLQINTYAQADATGFARSASTIAQGLLSGQLVVGPIFRGDGTVFIYHLWGLFLSPFWLLPGPSNIYAYLALIGVGTLAVHNIYRITSWYYSPTAGIIAALPVAVYPSFVFVQTSFLREATVLAAITTAARILIVPPAFLKDRIRTRGITVSTILLFVSLLRYDNVPLYAIALSIGIGAYYLRHGRFKRAKKLIAGVGVGVVTLLTSISSSSAVRYLSELSRVRARGRTAYLANATFQTVPEMILYAPLGAVFFLFTPFPWMITSVLDLAIAVEALGNLLFAVASISGIRYALQRSVSTTSALVVSFLAASCLYGLGTSNVGTAVRHRQMFVWVIYVFGAIGIVHWHNHRRWFSRWYP